MKRIVINTALQKYRQKFPLQLIREEPVEDVAIMTYEDESVTVDFLLECIQQLPDKYRLVFNLYVLDKFSHKEIAQMLHISEGTSKSNLSRARLALKQKIEVHRKAKKKA